MKIVLRATIMVLSIRIGPAYAVDGHSATRMRTSITGEEASMAAARLGWVVI